MIHLEHLQIHCFDSAAACAAAAADRWLGILDRRPKDRSFSVALSGGRIAGAFLGRVVARGQASRARFERVHFFWADERCVPPESRESNYRLAKERLLDPLGIPSECRHRIPGELAPDRAAQAARKETEEFFAKEGPGTPRFDMIFLGMGEDGHVASLFPENLDRDWPRRETYFETVASKPPPSRVSLGFGPILAAGRVWVLVSGPNKRAALLGPLNGTAGTPLARVIQHRTRSEILTDVLFPRDPRPAEKAGQVASLATGTVE